TIHDTTDTDSHTGSSGFISMLDGLLEKISTMDNDTVENIDSQLRARIGKLTNGLSPMQLILAYSDWLGHLSIAPARRLQLLKSLVEKVVKLSVTAAKTVAAKTDESLPQTSPLFKHELWKKPPFNILARGHLTSMEWLKELSTDVPGMSPANSDFVGFIT
ncbi:MAG: poly-beta-hydroxybutyrate polymerase N-terminal domain-containing protein, partial [Porticoccus sp.]|nr:poly-beta-hydroxybutyrate polymerase N-terminal domain-containing protein [Porticoccus sp.]